MTPARLKVAGTVLSAIFAGLAFAYPSHGAELAAAAAFLFGSLHIPRPGDARVAQ